MFIRNIIKEILVCCTFVCSAVVTMAQEAPKEQEYFRISGIPTPEGLILEVGGLTTLPNGDVAMATRRGDVYIIENPTGDQPYFRRFAVGLHEPLGLAYKDGSLYCAQRGELTKLTDKNLDGVADEYASVYSWPLSGHYHEYSYGPKFAADSSFFVSLNLAFGDNEGWRGVSKVPWRGWILKINGTNQIEPFATGLRSPCGLGIIDGELFYSDNQGDWMPSGGIMHLKKGTFAGNPAGLVWSSMPNSPVKLTLDQHKAVFDERRKLDKKGRPIQPQNQDTGKFDYPADLKKAFPEAQLPAVYLPHGILGVSSSEIVTIPKGQFGPFEGQVLVGDQGQSKISRIYLEKVNGEYQGVAWDFAAGFRSGVLRMSWTPDGYLFVGETNRGWGSAGDANQGVQKLNWTGKVPFEMLKVNAMPDGFEIEFTKPVNKKIAEDIANYQVERFTYKYHPVYGSPVMNQGNCPVKGIKISDDGKRVRLIVDSLQKTYIHVLRLDSIRSATEDLSLLHPVAYYTLHNIPEGKKLAMSEVSVKNSTAAKKAAEAKKLAEQKKAAAAGTTKKSPAVKVPTEAEIKPLLAKYTCSACHTADKKQVGPAFKDVAKRNYSIERMVQLMYKPE
ncbi:MAG: hypothetical protein J7497_14535, partial [Chitinophagaceae bacterium]|nr:hypothetical protein [Chitinophagaceae bacterium]